MCSPSEGFGFVWGWHEALLEEDLRGRVVNMSREFVLSTEGVKDALWLLR